MTFARPQLETRIVPRCPAPAFLALLLVALASVYAQVSSHEFVKFDDQTYVYDNPVVKQGLTWSGFRWSLTTFSAANWHPLTWMSHMLDVELSGLAPRGHHVTSLVIHGANAFLLWIWLRGITAAPWRSALVAGVFAIHPINVESVAWVAERKNVLSTLFLFGALIAYTRYVRWPDALRYGAVFLLLAASLASKAMAVSLPLLLLLLDFWPLGRFTAPVTWRATWPLIAEKIPLLTLSALASVLVYRAQSTVGFLEMLQGVTPAIRLSNAATSILAYLRKTVWPVDLACFYPHPEGALPLWQGLLAGVLLLAVTAAVLAGSGRRPALALGWIWYLGSLTPVLGFVQVGWQAMADRYAYVPLIGIFVAASWALPGPRSAGLSKKASAAAALAVLIFAATARVQAGYWRDNITLFEHAVAVTEDNWLAHSNLGGSYAARGEPEKAIFHMREALRLNRRYAIKPGSESRPAPPGHHGTPLPLPQGHPPRLPNRSGPAAEVTGRGERI